MTNTCKYDNYVEKWAVFEVSMPGKSSGNPFVDYNIQAVFQGKEETKTVDGFYDGDGIYRVRFMPSFEGEYTFTVKGSFSEEEFTGSFTAVSPSVKNHGPIRVSHTYHFAYEDGTPYYPVGTTCYVWELQSEELQEKTLKTLAENAFNKIRFCVFPKHYDYNLKEPRSYPYEGTPMDSSVLTKENFTEYNGCAQGNDFDYTRFHVEHFQHIEKCIQKLMDMGIEADLIVMHPYDRWGFSEMSSECDDLYLRYLIARVSAYRNIWWALANEYDLFPKKTTEDWERYARIICEKDAYSHLRSIHNCRPFYDHSRPWITHCSIQRQDLYKSSELVNEWRERYKKPIVLDEIAYEGNIQHGWGNITGEEMTRRFWEAFCRGGYPGHGETFLNEEEILWWAHGGELHGESSARIQFLKKIMDETPAPGLRPMTEPEAAWDEVAAVVDRFPCDTRYYMFYYSFMCPSFREYYFDEDTSFQVEVIDTWNMTVENRGVFQGKIRVDLPGRQYMAVRIREV